MQVKLATGGAAMRAGEAGRPRATNSSSPQPFRWHRTAAIGFAILFALFTVAGWIDFIHKRALLDFMSFWAAGRLTLDGTPALAYDMIAHRKVQEAVLGSFQGNMPFPYPPAYLFIVAPFSIAPYVQALLLWIAATGALYLAAARTVIRGPYALAHPSVLLNALIGQNSFLTFGIFVLGANRLRDRPFVAGLILGLLVIKPQLAVLLPVAVLASRRWPAIVGALLSASALLLLALLVFGPESYAGFLRLVPVYSQWMAQSKWPWEEFASPFAFLRFFGVDQAIALAIQAILLAGAAMLTWAAWAGDWKEKVAILAASTLLVSPYLLTYDALLLLVPLGIWLNEQRRPGSIVLVWFLCLLPIAHFLKLYDGPNTIPLASLLVLAFLWADRRLAVKSEPAETTAHPSFQAASLSSPGIGVGVSSASRT